MHLVGVPHLEARGLVGEGIANFEDDLLLLLLCQLSDVLAAL